MFSIRLVGFPAAIFMVLFLQAGQVYADLFGFQVRDTLLTKAGSPHKIIGDWEVSAGVTVTVEPGAVIKFKDSSDLLGANDYPGLSEIIVKGTFRAIGSSTDSIKFDADSTINRYGRWGKIKSTSQGRIVMKYAEISHAYAGVNLNSRSDTVENSSFYRCRHGMEIRAKKVRVYDNSVTYSDRSGVVVLADSVTVEKFTVTNCDSSGVVSNNYYLTILQTVCMRNKVYGIYCPTSSALIKNCVIALNTYGVTPGYYSRVENSSIHKNGYGIMFNVSYDDIQVVVKNCIITGNSYGLYNANADDTITFSNIWNNKYDNSANTLPTNTGINPFYVSSDTNNLDLHLQTISPLKVMGENGIEMGAYGGLNYAYPNARVTIQTPAVDDTADTTYLIKFHVQNPDDTAITYNLYYDTDLNSIAKTAIASGVKDTLFQWNTRGISNGDYYLFVEVVNGPSYDYSESKLTIFHPPVLPRPPFFTDTPDSMDTSATVNAVFRDTVHAYDLDSGNTLTYLLVAPSPGGMGINSQNGIVTWVPEITDTGFKTVAIVVRDQGGLSDTLSFVIHVTSLGTIIETGILPQVFGLSQAFPNPFCPSMSVAFSLPRTQFVRVMVYDQSGRLIKILADGSFIAGSHSMVWDARDEQGKGMASGTYLIRLFSEGKVLSRKVMLMR